MKKKMNKVLVVCTAAAAMTAFSGTAFGATLDLESKTRLLTAKDGAGDIQEAINQISGNGNKDGWTIKIKSGTYDRLQFRQILRTSRLRERKTALFR